MRYLACQSDNIDHDKKSCLSSRACTGLLCVWLCVAGKVDALRPDTQISQYGHMGWRVGDNGLVSIPKAIAQTTDGYIWIGTFDGLFRFDGIRFTRWSAFAGEQLPSQNIDSLLGTRDGSLYIATDLGLARLTRGHLYRYPAKARWAGALLEDAEGGIWTGQSQDVSGVMACRIGDKDVTCFGSKDGFGCRHGTALLSEKPGSVWVGSYEGICHLQADAKPETYLLPALSTDEQALANIDALAAGPDGTLWAGSRGLGPGRGLLTFFRGEWKSYVTPQIQGSKLPITSLFFDHNGSLWIGTGGNGIYKISHGHLDHFDTANGLEGNSAKQILEDSEGDLWVLTNGGVEVFRDLPVISYTTRSGLSDDGAEAITSTSDSSIWIGTLHALNILRNGSFSYIKRGYGLPVDNVVFLFRDLGGRIWMSGGRKLFLLRDGHFLPVVGQGVANVHLVASMAEDNNSDIWVSDVDVQTHSALLRLQGLQVAERISTPGGQTVSLARNPRGGLWVGGFRQGLFWFHDHSFEPLKARISSEGVGDLFSEEDGALWIFTLQHRILEYKGGKSQELTVRNGLPCDAAYGVLDDHSGSHWFYLQCGIVRVRDAELTKWWDDPAYHMKTTVFDSLDGAQPTPSSDELVASPDGGLWSVTGNSVQLIDTKHLPRNPLPPPVHIEQVIADTKNYSPENTIQLPKLSRNIEIKYTALSFVVPQRVVFRYKLEGYDADWLEVATRRSAFYTNLRPGNYKFHVIASNNDGVWNEAGASLAFSVAPAWFQTNWFRVACLGAFLTLMWGLYQLRLQQLRRQFNVQLEARINERTRIAQELHDTFFQGIQGLLLRFHTATSQLRKDEPVRRIFEETLKQSDQVMLEGRELVLDLRATVSESTDLPAAFADFGEEMRKGGSCDFKVVVNGSIRPLHPVVFEELFKIGKEALGNAFRHSGAHSIEAELNYERSELRVRVRDDGAGIDSAILRQGRRDGHFGLPGMRERAQKVGAHLDVWSRAGAGAEVELRIAAGVAYASNPNGSRLWKLRRLWRGSNKEGGPAEKGDVPS